MPIASDHNRPLTCRPRHDSASDNDHCRSIPPSLPSLFASTPASLFHSVFPPATMARTKQTAKKSTGGQAKRRLLEPPTRTLRSKSSRTCSVRQSPQPAADVEMAEEPSASKYFHYNNSSVHTEATNPAGVTTQTNAGDAKGGHVSDDVGVSFISP